MPGLNRTGLSGGAGVKRIIGLAAEAELALAGVKKRPAHKAKA